MITQNTTTAIPISPEAETAVDVTGCDRAYTLCVPPLVTGTDVTALTSQEVDVTVANVGTARGLEPFNAPVTAAPVAAAGAEVDLGVKERVEEAGDTVALHLASLPAEAPGGGGWARFSMAEAPPPPSLTWSLLSRGRFLWVLAPGSPTAAEEGVVVGSSSLLSLTFTDGREAFLSPPSFSVPLGFPAPFGNAPPLSLELGAIFFDVATILLPATARLSLLHGTLGWGALLTDFVVAWPALGLFSETDTPGPLPESLFITRPLPGAALGLSSTGSARLSAGFTAASGRLSLPGACS